MTDPTDGDRGFPAWLEPLLPDELARARLRRSILEEAERLLAAHRRGSWWEVAAGWTTLLAPTAAGLALLFGALAYRAGMSGSGAVTAAPTPEPVAASVDAVLPASLPADSSSADDVLNAAIYSEAW